MTALCAALLFAFITQEAGGATLFLSTSGHDTNNDGSEGYPFESLTKALSASVAGDTVVVKAGIYDGALNKGLSVNHDLILRAADVPTSNDKVIFDGGDAGGSILTDLSVAGDQTIRFSKLIVDFAVNDAENL